ncbi:hypothetical protein [Nonomuraea guangzhouensis]|uniref:Uncharacterized protein n=1 Tax=Nonomuraea guangzhouensis TaxID=1291555 RepID=A0ABW4G9S2_9ACTN|nr:hypothetical protein [Nonomuraea guangzhouensis]
MKPLTVTAAATALIALPFAGGAFADTAKPHPTTTVTPGPKTTPTTLPTAPVKTARPTPTADTLYVQETKRRDHTSLDVSVNPSRVKQGASYGVTIVVKGAPAGGKATITSPEGKSYRVSLDQRKVTKTLTVPAHAKPGTKTVSVKVGNRVATATFTVVGRAHRDDHRHEGK